MFLNIVKNINFNHPKFQYAKARYCHLAGDDEFAVNLLQDVVQQMPEPKYFYWLAIALLDDNQNLDSIEAFDKALESGYHPDKYFHRFYALALGNMDRHQKAVDEWLKYFKLESRPSREDKYIVALQYKYLGNDDKASEILLEIVNKSSKLNGEWNLYEKKELWHFAAQSIEDYFVNNEQTAELLNKLGLYYFYQGMTEKSVENFQASLGLRTAKNVQNNLMRSLEKLEDSEAIKQLAETIDLKEFSSAKKNRIMYTVAKSYMSSGEYEIASKIFSEYRNKTQIAAPKILENKNYIYAEKYIENRKFDEAIPGLLEVVYSYNGHSRQLFSLIGEAYYQVGNYEKACDFFIQQYLFQKNYGLSAERMKAKSFNRYATYTEYFENMPLNKDVVLYNAYHGDNFNDSPYALFKELYKRTELKHFIIVKSEDNVRKEIKKLPNVYLVKYHKRLFLRILASAGLIITNTTLPPYFMRREGQTVLNTWHGTPIKYLGYDIETNPYASSKNVENLFLQNTHLVNPNQFTENALIKSFTLNKMDDTQFAITGYPRQDLMINATMERKQEIKNFLNIPLDQKVVLYAPTFRGANNKSDNREKKMVDKAKKLLSNKEEFAFIYKGHYFEDGVENKANVVDTNELLSIVDVLITDYSSIAIDFLAMSRPIIYFTYDIDEYRAERGFYFELDEISNNLVATPDELAKMVEEQIAAPVIDSKQEQARIKFCSLDDGKASKRVLEFIERPIENKKKEKKDILIYPGNIMAINGITTSFKNLISLMDLNKYNITVVIPDAILNNFPDQSVITELKERGISIICYYGFLNRTVEEDKYLSLFVKNKQFFGETHQELYLNLWERKAKQVFGTRSFDTVINFDSGYTINIHALLAATPAKQRLLIVHADMESERQVRYPNLKTSFNLFNCYDKILTVSNSVSEKNIESLSDLYQIPVEKFSVLENTLNVKFILEQAELDLEEERDNNLFTKGAKTFISVGRISPEKNLEVAIRAFAKVKEKHENISYIILGGGAQETQLKVLITELNLDDSVFLLGPRSNPFNYMKKSNCLLFPSLHEGQPMVLLEALTNNLDILASNIPANKEMIDNYGGKYIENTVESFTTEMCKYLENDVNMVNKFDPENYNHERLEKLYSFID